MTRLFRTQATQRQAYYHGYTFEDQSPSPLLSGNRESFHRSQDKVPTDASASISLFENIQAAEDIPSIPNDLWAWIVQQEQGPATPEAAQGLSLETSGEITGPRGQNTSELCQRPSTMSSEQEDTVRFSLVQQRWLQLLENGVSPLRSSQSRLKDGRSLFSKQKIRCPLGRQWHTSIY